MYINVLNKCILYKCILLYINIYISNIHNIDITFAMTLPNISIISRKSHTGCYFGILSA